MTPGQFVIGYARRSKASGRTPAEQLTSELHEEASITAQREQIERECHHRGWTLTDFKTDILSGATLHRPELQAALDLCRSGEASGIVVAKLDRLSRSVIDFANLLQEAKDDGWNIVALDFGLDLNSPNGALMANVLMAVAQWERAIIGERTRLALAVKREQGVHIGRRSNVPAKLSAEIVAMREGRTPQQRRMTLAAIANLLNEQRVPTAQGGLKWYASTVLDVLRRAA